MGVYIRGMEMPFTCLTCNFHRCAGGVGDFCSLTRRRMFRFKNRPKDCPLVELSSHGRLVDADALKSDGFYTLVCYTGEMPYEYTTMSIDDAPTVIEAEEGE